MQFRLGPPPVDPAFCPQPPWRPLREPRSVALLTVLALPLGLVVALGFLLLAVLLQPDQELVLSFDVVGLVLLLPVHEALHAVVVPGSLAASRLVIGFWPRALLAYVHYAGELGRTRWLVVTLFPFLVVSLLTLVLSWMVPDWSGPLLSFGLLNALASGGDFLAAILVLAQVPPQARLRNQGWQTYWRRAVSGERSV